MSSEQKKSAYQSPRLKTEFEPVLRFFEVKATGNLFKDVTSLATAIENAQIDEKLTRFFFDFYDRDGNGKIDRSEFETLVMDISEAMGQPSGALLDPDQVNEAMEQLDADGSGHIEWKEFKEWFDQVMKRIGSE